VRDEFDVAEKWTYFNHAGGHKWLLSPEGTAVAYVVCREGLVRASPHCYKTREEEVGTFLEVLEDA